MYFILTEDLYTMVDERVNSHTVRWNIHAILELLEIKLMAGYDTLILSWSYNRSFFNEKKMTRRSHVTAMAWLEKLGVLTIVQEYKWKKQYRMHALNEDFLDRKELKNHRKRELGDLRTVSDAWWFLVELLGNSDEAWEMMMEIKQQAARDGVKRLTVKRWTVYFKALADIRNITY